ncbi:acyltransferase family protein [Thermodesulfobacteriota bacterium]
MSHINAKTTNHFPMFDNLRTLMVLLVLVFHSGASYGSAVDFWPFHETDPSMLIDIFMLLGDTFMMAVLFFIAGYFAVSSAHKHGGWGFIRNKFKRVAIPWLLITLFLLPLLDYVHYHARSIQQGVQARGYVMHWLLSLKEIGRFRTGWLDMSSYINMTEQFYQRYMWFLSLLFIFFIIFIAIYEINKKIVKEKDASIHEKEFSQRSVFAVLVLISIITILLFSLVRFLLYPEFMVSGWFSLVGIIQCQVGKLGIYACYFSLGCYAYSKKWFFEKIDFGRPWLWILSCFLLFGGNMAVLGFITKYTHHPIGLRIAFVILYPLWTLSFLGFFMAVANKYWNRSTSFSQNLASNSYNMYLLHYIFPMTLPLLLSAWTGGPVLLKFGIVAAVTILASYGISRYIMKPLSRFYIPVI